MHFFQTIKVYQNYFAILAKMIILSLNIVDINYKNESLNWGSEGELQNTVGWCCRKWILDANIGLRYDSIWSLITVTFMGAAILRF